MSVSHLVSHTDPLVWTDEQVSRKLECIVNGCRFACLQSIWCESVTTRQSDRCWTKWSLCAAMLRRRHKKCLPFGLSFNCYECQWARTLELISTAQLAEKHILNTNQMHLWNRDASRQQKSPNMANIAVLYFDPAPPQGNVMSVKCRKPLDELAVQVWLLYRHANFKYCTLYVSGTKLRTGDPITRCPRRIFQAGGIKTMQIRTHLPGRSKLFLLVNPWVSKAIKLQSVWTSEKD